MRKLFVIALSLLWLTACDGVGLSSTKEQYDQAVASGDLAKQIQLVDELYQQDSAQYMSLFDEKEQLLSVIEQLNNNPRGYENVSESLLKRVLVFAPNVESFSLAKRYMTEREKLYTSISDSETLASQIKTTIAEKLRHTPQHVETYDTEISTKGIAPYFLTSVYGKAITKQLAKNSLSGYQLTAVAKGLADLFTANETKLAALEQLGGGAVAQLNNQDREFLKENGDIQRILLALYKKQLVKSYYKAIESNDYLLSLLNSSYGRERLDDVWLRLVEPAAKKAVMNAKTTYLNALDLLAGKVNKTAMGQSRLKKVYKETLSLDEALLSLMWPPNGLENFQFSSSAARKKLKADIAKIQQL